MCDTVGFISEHHILVEKLEVNSSRRLCHGILLQIHRNSFGVGRITMIKSCAHGKGLGRDMDEEQYSCRKIRTVITEDKHVPLYK
jgi:hypothetical protein